MNELNNLIDIEVDEIATAHPNYFPGQYLLAEDFNLEHKYLNDHLRYTNKSLHVSGIIEGLTVKKEGTNSVKITPGAAIDNQGNMIVIKEDTTFDGFNTINQGELYVRYIKQKDIQQQQDVTDSYTRWQEKPQLGFADRTPETGVKLAKITLEEGAITEVVTDVREYSGLSLPTSNGTELTLRYGGTKEGINEAVLTGSLHINNNLTVDGKLGIGTNTPEANLHIHGVLKLQEGVAVNKISGDDELTENSDQIIPTQKAIKTYADRIAVLAGIATQDCISQNLTVSQDLNVSGSIIPSAGKSENNGIIFPKYPGGGGSDAAWIRYYVRSQENTTLEIGTRKDQADHIALMTEGNVGIGTISPVAKLEIKGNLKLEEGVAVNKISDNVDLGNSDQIIATQKAIKTYIDREIENAYNNAQARVYMKGMIMLWPVVKDSQLYQDLPPDWKECDGRDGRPNINGRLVCGIATTKNGLEEFKNKFEVTATNDMHFYNEYMDSTEEEYLYGRPKGTVIEANVFDQWKGVCLVEEMLPNHQHEGVAYGGNDHSLPSDLRIHTFKYANDEQVRNIITDGTKNTNKLYEVDYVGEHQHRVRVGRGEDGKSQEEGSSKQGLPQPPFIVLRYIIYWPD